MADISGASSSKAKSSLSTVEKAFEALKKKIKNLYNEKDTTKRELDASLQWYYELVVPEQRALYNAFIDKIRAFYNVYKNSDLLAEEKKIIIYLVEEDLEKIDRLSDVGMVRIPQDVKNIIQELMNYSIDDDMKEDLKDMRDTIQEQCEDKGIKIDLSKINMNRSIEEVMKDIFGDIEKAIHEQEKDISIREFFSGQGSFFGYEIPPRKKTKKQEEKDLKEQLQEELEKKSMKSIYRGLAKVLHPDLEQNDQEKLVKEEQLKKINGAYKERDLYALLALEAELIDSSTSNNQLLIKTPENLAVYNSILKKQAKELRQKVDCLILDDSRYAPLQGYYGMFGSSVQDQLVRYHTFLKKQFELTQKYIQPMELVKLVKIVKKDIAQIQKEQAKKKPIYDEFVDYINSLK